MPSNALHVSPDALRRRFSAALSRMYRQEVPAYGTLLTLVEAVNARVRADSPTRAGQLDGAGDGRRLGEERHGAIRLGTADELATLGRLFALLGMRPVGYYDLSVAGLPVHSTAFRPITIDALRDNAFRVFVSWLRLELLADGALRDEARALLASRDIFPARLRSLICRGERDGGLDETSATQLLEDALSVFRWHASARAKADLYGRLLRTHGLIADVVCFRGPHINHLTPRTLDIEAVQAGMPACGITPKAIIEGPPARVCPILLRQTSFRALEEPILFPDGTGSFVAGTHTARFGEVEQRGAALTPAGRALYDQLLADAHTPTTMGAGSLPLQMAFSAFPDDWEALRIQQLAWFQYQLTDSGVAAAPSPQAAALLAAATLPGTPQAASHSTRLDALIAQGWIIATPIIYEDFLPVSAAGIFRSNLDQVSAAILPAEPARTAFEAALGMTLLDEQSLYSAQQQASIESCLLPFDPFTTGLP
jgi:uncharacterized glyoxalase superfamily metalloenzyme YdcJ